ncbi:2-keto-4-pentenoate hydratase [Steroidobacter agaridevorans]|uniref:2-keto-4-pentenoate hydratase n=1 Tax=Steroidobacter agaridevorans TaxID=2695856 RepID=A0A829YEZ4_9GAMM|nr:fumarylacetoacetate hydrolase family protein [Steroidobacter agaridevorans]GFE81780.1 2-keto-4-pentenoate hydratase [Steroidobacter agaridevorans]
MSASNSEAVAAAHAALSQAAKTRTPCDPIRSLIEPLGVAGAYEVQSRLTADALAAGRRIIGAKIGLTSLAVQKQLGVDQPDFGMLFDDMEYGDDALVPISRLIQPKVEAEIAFVLEKDLDAERPTLAQVASAIAYALPAIEIVDSRVRDWKISLYDTIADNASSGLFVLGGTPRKIDKLDLKMCGARLDNRGEAVSTGCGAACLGNPLNAVVWLARTMSKVGQPLRAGTTILSGALGPMVTVKPGEVYEARISGLGRVAAAFTQE